MIVPVVFMFLVGGILFLAAAASLLVGFTAAYYQQDGRLALAGFVAFILIGILGAIVEEGARKMWAAMYLGQHAKPAARTDDPGKASPGAA